MKNYLIMLFLSLMTISAIANEREDESQSVISCRGGGDGPGPLHNFTPSLPKEATLIPTQGSVRDFIHWPNRNSIIYRNGSTEVFEVSLDTGRSRYITQMDHRMSRVLDPTERYILTDKNNWYADATQTNPTWGQFAGNRDVSHLFWHRDVWGRYFLFSLSNLFETPSQQSIKILTYRAGKVEPEKCRLPTEDGEVYYVGSGHYHPYVFLYKIKETAGGSQLTLVRVQVMTIPFNGKLCDIKEVKTYPELIPGDIQMVYQFEEKDTFAVVSKLASTTKLFWDSRKDRLECNFRGADPIVLNTKVPAVMAWYPGSGLHMIYPDTREEAQILTSENGKVGLTTAPLSKENLWLSDSGEKLFIAQKWNESGGRKLHSFDLRH